MSANNVNIVTVLKSGGSYDASYIKVLRNALSAHGNTSKLFCLTDVPEEVEKYAVPINLEHNLPGWWSKIELFKPDLLQGYDTNTDFFLYLDLDTLILSDIKELLELIAYVEEPLMLRCRPLQANFKDWPASGIMGWKGNALQDVYDAFFSIGAYKVIEEQEAQQRGAGQRGDQGFIRKIINPYKFQDFLPDNYIQFKRDFYHTGISESCHILAWSGKPRLHKTTNPLFNTYWRRYV